MLVLALGLISLSWLYSAKVEINPMPLPSEWACPLEAMFMFVISSLLDLPRGGLYKSPNYQKKKNHKKSLSSLN